MNQREYKRFLHLPKEKRPESFFKYRNLAEKLLGYKRRQNLVIHHLRDTEEQREFNDNYYERWGIDFNGEMKYCILVTKEEHTAIHKLSEETKAKISKSVSISKTKLTREQRKENKKCADSNYRKQNKEKIKKYKEEYYIKNQETIKENVKEYRNSHKDKIREYNKKWKEKNRDKVLEAKRKAYRKKKQLKNSNNKAS